MLNNPISRYRFFLGIELAVSVAVVVIFRVIQDRPTAGLVAGSLFLISTLYVLITEARSRREVTAAGAGAALFLAGGVLPILILRAMSWGEPFETASLFGIPGSLLHRSSNYLFMAFLVGIFISLQKARLQARAAETKKDP